MRLSAQGRTFPECARDSFKILLLIASWPSFSWTEGAQLVGPTPTNCHQNLGTSWEQ